MPPRAPHPTDRRTTLATISQTGREVAEAATEALHAISFGTPPLGKAKLEAITDLLRPVRESAGDFSGE